MFHALPRHPLVQKKAQEEIDRVAGLDRLPDYSDQASLPYIEAIYREVMRWRPVLSLGIPRNVFEDDIYNGYFRPKGLVLGSRRCLA